jgi:hypothetical protein
MTEEAKKADPRTVQLKHVRLSFCDSLKDARPTVKDGVPKHASNFILEADDPLYEENKAKVVAAIKEACDQEWKNPDAYKAIMEDDPKRLCFRKGERFKNQTSGEVYKGYEGNWAVAGTGPGGNKNPRRPKLFDRGRRPLKDQATREQLDQNKFFEEKGIPDIFYSGTYGDVILAFYATNEGGRGVFCSIEAVRSHQEGERMAGGTYVDADMFDELDGDDAFDGADVKNDPLG